MMRHINVLFAVKYFVAAILVVQLSSYAQAGTVTFTPIGASTVTAGTDVVMEVTVQSVNLASFDAADIIIGANDITDINFAYDVAWTSAFADTSTPLFDVGFYNQDVFVGGNNTTPVGSMLVLGTVTINTTGMSVGSHQVVVDNAIDNFSRLALAGNTEPLTGTGNFQIEVAGNVPAASQWGLIVMTLSLLIAGTLCLRKRSAQLSDY